MIENLSDSPCGSARDGISLIRLAQSARSYRRAALARGLSPRTVRTTEFDLQKLDSYMVERDLRNLADLSDDQLRGFRTWLGKCASRARGRCGRRLKLCTLARV